jgi:hypothetical protein
LHISEVESNGSTRGYSSSRGIAIINLLAPIQRRCIIYKTSRRHTAYLSKDSAAIVCLYEASLGSFLGAGRPCVGR